MKTIVIYKSKYGSSGQYAAWLAEALDCSAEEIKNVKIDELLVYDVIVYVGGLYAGSVNGYKKISENLSRLKDKKLILCMVGNTNPAEIEKYDQVFMKNVPEEYRSVVKPFALRGDQLFSKMSVIHRLMMKMPKSMAEKIPVEQRTEDDKQFIENYGKDVYFVNKESINDIVEYIKK